MLKGKKYFKNDGALKFLICLGFSAGVMILVSLIMALIASATKNPGGLAGILALATMIISAAAGGVFTVKMKSDESILYPMLVSLSVVLIMLLVAVILCGGKVPGSAFMNYGCYLGVYALASVLGKHKPTHRRHKR